MNQIKPPGPEFKMSKIDHIILITETFHKFEIFILKSIMLNINFP